MIQSRCLFSFNRLYRLFASSVSREAILKSEGDSEIKRRNKTEINVMWKPFSLYGCVVSYGHTPSCCISFLFCLVFPQPKRIFYVCVRARSLKPKTLNGVCIIMRSGCWNTIVVSFISCLLSWLDIVPITNLWLVLTIVVCNFSDFVFFFAFIRKLMAIVLVLLN